MGKARRTPHRLEWLALHRKIYRSRNLSYVEEYLVTHPCVDCGTCDPFVLEFDHVRGKKRKGVMTMALGGSHSLKSIQREIDKCEVRCGSCHARRHKIERIMKAKIDVDFY